MPLTVSLIFDLDFGSKLIDLTANSVIWACESNRNEKAAEDARIQLSGKKPVAADPINTFEFDRKSSLLIAFREILSTIEEHHPWTTLNVYGALLSKTMKDSLLSEFEAISVQETTFGFTAERK